MKKSITLAIELSLAATALVLLVLLVLPGSSANGVEKVRPSAAVAGTGLSDPIVKDAGGTASGTAGPDSPGVPLPKTQPEVIARFFGWTPPAVVTPTRSVLEPVRANTPVKADWLSFVGKVQDGAGGYTYFFRNNRTGRIEKAAGANADWIIIETDSKQLLLMKDGEKFTAEVK